VFDRLSDKELRFSLRIQASGRTIDPPRATLLGANALQDPPHLASLDLMAETSREQFKS